MNKRCELFILNAIIICMMIHMVTAKYNTAKEYGGVEGFKELSENYDGELIKVINWNTLEGIPKEDIPDTEEDMPGKIADYTRKYTKFRRKEDPNYGIAYLYKSKDPETDEPVYIIRNFLSGDKKIIIKFTNLDDTKQEIKLFNEEERTKGTINLAFMGSMGKMGVSVPISAFGEDFVQGRVPGGVKKMSIYIDGTPYSFGSIDRIGYVQRTNANLPDGRCDGCIIDVKVTEA